MPDLLRTGRPLLLVAALSCACRGSQSADTSAAASAHLPARSVFAFST